MLLSAQSTLYSGSFWLFGNGTPAEAPGITTNTTPTDPQLTCVELGPGRDVCRREEIVATGIVLSLLFN